MDQSEGLRLHLGLASYEHQLFESLDIFFRKVEDVLGNLEEGWSC